MNNSSLINYVIGLVAIVAVLSRVNQKAIQDPSFNINGIGIKNIQMIAYVGIGIFILLILLEIFGKT